MNERDIFLSALDIEDQDSRALFLQEQCAGDTGLLTRVKALLSSHESQSRFLKTPAVAQLAENAETAGAPTQHILREATEDEPHARDTRPDETIIKDFPGDDDEIPLGYLSPSDRVDSLGRLKHYEILEVIGRGAFGIVLKAFDESLQRVVAIKVLSPELAATSPARKRFQREAESSGKVRHENVVAIYAVEADPIPYLVMEYIPGETLQQRLDAKGPLEITEILRLGKQMADGLAAAHAQGLIHRDIKPGNILLETSINDHLKLTDFGLARAADDASMTQSGLIAGTPMYMAPEQALGQKLDQRADLFSLGSVMYQMVSGRPPFRAPSTVAVLKRVAEDTPRPIKEIIPETPDWLCEFIETLHAKDPNDRYQTAREVAELLEQCQRELLEAGKVTCITGNSKPSGRKQSSANKPRRLPSSKSGLNKRGLLAFTFGIGAMLLILFAAPKLARWFDKTIPSLPAGKSVGGLRFDGKDDSVQVSGLNWQYPQFTIEAFVTSQAGSDNGTICQLMSARSQQSEWMSLFDGGPTGPDKRISGAAIKGKTPFENAYGPFTAGERQHRALVFDGRYLNYYINGVWQGKRFAEPHVGLVWNMENLHIGCDGEGRRFFQGVIDQLRISKTARYEATFSPITSVASDGSTLALYNFDEGTGDVLTDSSGNGHHGTIVGAKWVELPSNSEALSPKVDIAGTPPSVAEQAEWVNLFNGRDLTGWKTRPELPGQWEVKDGILIGSTSQGYLFSERGDFENFHLRVEAKISGRGDGRILFRVPFEFRFGPQRWMTQPATGYEAGLYNHPEPTGSLWKIVRGVRPQLLRAAVDGEASLADEWFTLEIIANRDHVITRVNGRETVNCLDDAQSRYGAGHLALSVFDAKSVVQFRKIEIRELPPSEPSVPATVKHHYVSDEWIDVIPLIDPQLDKWDMRMTGKNEWRLEQGELVVGDADEKPSKLLFPLDADFFPSFECIFDVTRRAGDLGFNLNFPTANGDTPLNINSLPNRGLFLRLARQGLTQLADGPLLETGKRTTFRVEVRRQEMGDRVSVWNAGTLVGSWTGDRNELLSINNEGYRHNRRLSLWIGGGGNEFVFHSIRVRMLDGGTADTLRPVPGSLSPSRSQFTDSNVARIATQPSKPAMTSQTWVPLHNGQDLTGWKTHPDQPGNWRVEDGVLVSSGMPSYLFSERGDFRDFELRCEVSISQGGDGGLFVRSPFLNVGPEGLPGYETQIQSGQALATGWTTGAIAQNNVGSGWSLKQPSSISVKPDAFFPLEIKVIGSHVESYVNGEKTAEYDDPEMTYQNGHIALQHSGEYTVIKYRKIEIRELKSNLHASSNPELDRLVELAEADLKRAQIQFEKGVIPDSQVEVSEIELAEAKLKQAEANQDWTTQEQLYSQLVDFHGRQLKRVRMLHEKGVVPPAEVNTAERKVLEMQSRWNTARAARDLPAKDFSQGDQETLPTSDSPQAE